MKGSENTSRQRISERFLSAVRHERYLALLGCLALVVAVGAIGMVMRRGIAMVHTETVLDCHYQGNGAHTHTSDCYDKSMSLVCPLQERELHTHDDSCYTLESLLTCDIDEGEDHTHTDECYETVRTLTCDKEEVTEEHTHGPGCFKTITVNSDGEIIDEEPAFMAEAPVLAKNEAQTFDAEITDIEDPTIVLVKVHVDAPDGAFPEGTTMRATLSDNPAIEQAVDDAVADIMPGKTKYIQAVDITFHDEHGNEIEPAKKIEVKLTSDLIADNDERAVVRVDDDGSASVVDTLSEGELAERNESVASNEVRFNVGDD